MSAEYPLPSKFHAINLKSNKFKSITFCNACIALMFLIEDFLSSSFSKEAG